METEHNDTINPSEPSSLSRKLIKLYQAIEPAVEELEFLNELAIELGTSRKIEGVIATLLHRTVERVKAQQGLITLLSDEEKEDITKTWSRIETKTMIRTSTEEEPKFRLSQVLLEWMLINKRPRRLNNLQEDESLRHTFEGNSIDSILYVPLLVRSKLIGILAVFNKNDKTGFTEENLGLLTIIAAQAAQVIENACLFEQEVEMQENLKLVREIQDGLLPTKSPSVKGYDIAGKSIPAQQVGGDFFDYIPVQDDRLALWVGDVSGKGLPASLLMANMQATLRANALWSPSVKECLERSNQLLCKSVKKGKFVTLFYGQLDIVHHQFRYANAGHNRPLLLRPNQSAHRLELGDLVLGFSPEASYQEGKLALHVGDVILVYSDGISEARNEQGEEFDEKGLVLNLVQHQHEPASVIIDQIVKAVRRHAGRVKQMDDMTLLVIKRIL